MQPPVQERKMLLAARSFPWLCSCHPPVFYNLSCMDSGMLEKSAATAAGVLCRRKQFGASGSRRSSHTKIGGSRDFKGGGGDAQTVRIKKAPHKRRGQSFRTTSLWRIAVGQRNNLRYVQNELVAEMSRSLANYQSEQPIIKHKAVPPCVRVRSRLVKTAGPAGSTPTGTLRRTAMGVRP
jgi:hypothetical protein